jgi:hypothetical protein
MKKPYGVFTRELRSAQLSSRTDAWRAAAEALFRAPQVVTQRFQFAQIVGARRAVRRGALDFFQRVGQEFREPHALLSHVRLFTRKLGLDVTTLTLSCSEDLARFELRVLHDRLGLTRGLLLHFLRSRPGFPFGTISVDPLRVEATHGRYARLALREPPLTRPRRAQSSAPHEPNEGQNCDQRPEAGKNQQHARTTATGQTTVRRLWRVIRRPADRAVAALVRNLRS